MLSELATEAVKLGTLAINLLEFGFTLNKETRMTVMMLNIICKIVVASRRAM